MRAGNPSQFIARDKAVMVGIQHVKALRHGREFLSLLAVQPAIVVGVGLAEGCGNILAAVFVGWNAASVAVGARGLICEGGLAGLPADGVAWAVCA